MKKKITSALLSASMLLAAGAYVGTSAQDYVLTGEISGDTVVFGDIDTDKIILNGYSKEDKVLQYSKLFTAEDGKITAPDDITEYYLRAYIPGTDMFLDVEITEPQTPEATPTPTPDVQEEEFPSIYEEKINALTAFSVVDQISTEVQDGEKGYRIDYYKNGKKCSDWVSSDIQITTVPGNASGTISVPAEITSLEKGDVIYIDTGAFFNKIKQIALICEKPDSDIITNPADFGADFEKLFSVQGVSVNAVGGYSGWKVLNYGSDIPSDGTYYAFGLAAAREENVLYLMNKAGLAGDCIEIVLSEDTIVYECSNNDRNGIKNASIYSIYSSLSNQTWDDALSNPATPVTFDADDNYCYALVRVVDGTAMDIMLYSDY